MEEETNTGANRAGRFLPHQGRSKAGKKKGCPKMAAVLLLWDCLLVYMIRGNLIEPVYGAAFVAAVSAYMGYLL